MIFKENDKAVCRYAEGYHLTLGKEYSILEFSPPVRISEVFTLPAYVLVMDDNGKIAECHADRFSHHLKEEYHEQTKQNPRLLLLREVQCEVYPLAQLLLRQS